MAYVTPKTNWLASDGVANTDFNRIEGNIVDLKANKADLAGATFAGGVGFTEVDNGASGAAKNINFTTGNKQKLSVSANTTLTFTAPTAPCSLTLKLTYTGAFTVTLPAHKKVSGVALTFSSTNGATDILSIYWDGTSYYIMNSLGWA